MHKGLGGEVQSTRTNGPHKHRTACPGHILRGFCSGHRSFAKGFELIKFQMAQTKLGQSPPRSILVLVDFTPAMDIQ
jgi:hypothetical protein